MFLFSSQSPLPVSGTETYRGMAFDGCRYYLTTPCAPTVTVVDQSLRPVDTVRTRRIYGSICYDPLRACFWALSSQCRATLFQLDHALREIGRFEPRTDTYPGAPLSGLSFCCESGRLLAACGDQLLEVDPDSREARPLYRTGEYTLMLAVLCLPPYILLQVLRGTRPHFILLSRDGKVLDQSDVPQIPAAALALDPRTYDLLLLTNRQGCYPHLLRARLDGEIRDALCPCNRALCRRCGEDRPDACAEILGAVAMAGTSLAHILAAEGEKLRAIIEGTDSACELLAVNESVQRTLLHAAQLEGTLLAQLESLQTICCPCGSDAPCPSGSQDL